MKKQEEEIISLDEFETVSLYQLMPNSDGKSLSHLKTIVNSILLNPEQQQRKPLSLLVVGPQATRTHARAFIRALGIEEITETPAQLLHASYNAINEFFDPLFPAKSFLISNVETLYPSILNKLYDIITKGKYTWCDYNKRSKGIVAVYNPVVMTAHDISKIPDYFQESISHVVMLGEYPKQNLELVVLQRLKYARIDYEDEKVLSLIVEYSHNLHNIIMLLKNSITLMLAGNRSVLTVDDVHRGRKISLLRIGAPPMEDIPF
jgi:hypothetical protein